MRNRTKGLATIADITLFCSAAKDKFQGLTSNNLIRCGICAGR